MPPRQICTPYRTSLRQHFPFLWIFKYFSKYTWTLHETTYSILIWTVCDPKNWTLPLMFSLIFLVPFDHRKHIVIRADIRYSTSIEQLHFKFWFLFLYLVSVLWHFSERASNQQILFSSCETTDDFDSIVGFENVDMYWKKKRRNVCWNFNFVE